MAIAADKTRRSKKRREILGPADMFIVPYGGYPQDVLVAIAMSADAIRADLESRGVRLSAYEIESLNLPSRVVGRTLMLDSGPTILRLNNWIGTPADHGRLAHEVFHAVTLYFASLEMKLRPSSDEAYAYAIENLMTAILEELAKPPSLRGRG